MDSGILEELDSLQQAEEERCDEDDDDEAAGERQDEIEELRSEFLEGVKSLLPCKSFGNICDSTCLTQPNCT